MPDPTPTPAPTQPPDQALASAASDPATQSATGDVGAPTESCSSGPTPTPTPAPTPAPTPTPTPTATPTPTPTPKPTPYCWIDSQTVATAPANLARTKIGVGEEVNLTFSGGTATWTTTGGRLSSDSGATVRFTAPDRAASITITATGSTCTATIPFNVVEPSDVAQRQTPGTNVKHTVNKPSTGMKMDIYLLPDDVCFYNVETIEEEATANDTGVYALIDDKAHHPDTTPSTNSMTVVAGLGTKCNGQDKAYSGYPLGTPPFAPGSRIWVIPTNFRVGGGAWKLIKPVTQQHTLASDGTTLTMSKAGGPSPAIQVSDSTSSY